MTKHEIRLLLEQAEIDNLPMPTLEDESKEQHYSTTLAKWQDDKGREFVASGDFDEAERIFKMAIDTYRQCYCDLWEVPPDLYNPYYHLAQCYSFREKHKDAIKAYLNALAASESFRQYDYDGNFWYLELDIYIKIGRIYVELGVEEMAYYYFEKAVGYLNKQ